MNNTAVHCDVSHCEEPTVQAALTQQPAPAKQAKANHLQRLGTRLGSALSDERGMTTVEYALCAVAAAALAGILIAVVNGGAVSEAFQSIITDALNNRPG
ncbi:DUF4244 domain-containing protein [Corynebacterium lizhenjunii]|uniref:DUF4244 domain-containing protein n=1 Tax=Corynebacterium lizhenjunii TaxID=2709394 RepID=A0A7T0PA09_9CORY|nr:DUF4244 domain-containing protein [Corynebacterium lizhenjunii]